MTKVKEESEKVGLKLNIQKTKIMATGPITSWQIDGEIVETVADFIFLGSKITADGDCSNEIKRRLLLGRKIMSNLDSILKSRDITLPTKVCLAKAMVFPVVMYGCESWTVKKAECQRIDAFELWCWKGLLRVPWTARRSNQSILKELSLGVHWKDWCWSWNSNTLATWCKELTHWKRPWCWERLRAGGEGGDRGWDGWMASSTRWTWVWADSWNWWWTERTGVLWFMGSQRVRHNWATELNWIHDKHSFYSSLLDYFENTFIKRNFRIIRSSSKTTKQSKPNGILTEVSLSCYIHSQRAGISEFSYPRTKSIHVLIDVCPND